MDEQTVEVFAGCNPLHEEVSLKKEGAFQDLVAKLLLSELAVLFGQEIKKKGKHYASPLFMSARIRSLI